MIGPWILAARPKTLSAAVVPVLIGSALAAHEPAGVRWWVFVCALVGAVMIQVATNFINDALDFKKGADTGQRLGPLRVTQAGLISAEGVMRAAWLCLFFAAICGIPLLYRCGWPMLLVGLASIAAAYLYTGGPYPLAYHGLGELFVIVFFGFIAVGGTFYAHSLQLTRSALVAGFAAGALATVLLVINNLRDVDGDRRSNKRTTVVRFGTRFARAEIAFFALAPFAADALVAWMRDDRWLLLPLVALPLAIMLLVRVARSNGAELNRCLGIAGALQWAFGLLFVLGSVIG
ncbi:MAG: 1,4-dihydroxy-2-naphthoate polyprenyltransferase [Acidobacteria bacterium]|nr:1,4-dihydroxy-2-naphthoate polyprenyltransferase [Acidobacteriota bacterium]MBV9475490.1 1,4-dihydroxy-2-naphthoate polyprenyltransferase [Acidobacteriota bacterium]